MSPNFPPAIPIQLLKPVIVLFSCLPLTTATFTIARCCTLAVRTEFSKYYDEKFPWQVCNFNADIDYGTNETYVSITRPISWAKEFCPGMQLSNTRQWLQPLATYISPYIGLLLLCPMGATEPDDDAGQSKPWASIFWTAIAKLKELVSILGDPASAISGAASEIYADTVALWDISSLSDEKKRRARWVAALAGALKFSSETDWRRQGPSPQPESEALLKGTSTTEEVTQPYVDISGEETSRAISLCISARASFASTILIPVVLMLAVTAATFYDANANKGDKDTGLALAYCIWYSWILVPAVAGNCFATVLSPDLARRAFHKVMVFGAGERVIVPLRDRHVNNQFWGNWLRRQEDSKGAKEFAEFGQELSRGGWFWVRMLAWNLLGWCVVGVACGAAVAIAWTTPTVGLGCRSFNFLLYGILAFANACLQVLYSWLTVREGDKQKQARTRGRITVVAVVRAVYWFLVCFNALAVVVLGTIFHLVGVYRTCLCDRITMDDSVMIELNSKTAEAYENAEKYWISTAYVVFSIMTLICLAGVVFRQVISHRMDEWIESEEDFIQDNTHASSSSISVKLESLIGINLKGHRDETVRLAGKLIHCHRLTQHDLFWEALKADPSVQKQVPGWVSFRNPLPPCLVVGVMIAQDVKVEVPATQMASGLLTGGPPAVATESTVGNPSLGATATNAWNASFIGMTAQGDGQIFALELLAVTTKFLNWKTLQLRTEGPNIPEGRMAAAGDAESPDEKAKQEAMKQELWLEGLRDDDLEKLESAEW